MTVLVVGHRLSTKERSVREAIERVAADATFINSRLSLDEVLARKLPRCVLTDSHQDTYEINRALRERADCSGVPLIALVDQVSDQNAIELHRVGADDICSMHDVAGLTRRLTALERFDPTARTALSQGSCLLAHPDFYRRQVLGRVLRQAGFDVSFAGTMQDAIAVAERVPPKVVVVSDELPPAGGRSALEALSRHWLGVMPGVLLSNEPAARPMDSWYVVPHDSPPDDLLFVLNELLRPRELLESRASRRVLYSTLCAFRAAGELESRYGLTYNISREGLYIRSFDAGERGPVWLDLRPPGSKSAVHIRGELVWTRTLATGARGTAPPGFGVRLSPDACPSADLQTYMQCYEALLATQPEPSRTPSDRGDGAR
jgi:DNA-binding response OmpR family regulator